MNFHQCHRKDMVARFKLLLQILMILLALDVFSPEVICAGNPSQPTKPTCCSVGMTCNCHHDTNGSHSCQLSSQTSLSDKNAPTKSGTAPSPRLGVFLFALVPIALRPSFAQSAFQRNQPNVSPPFGDSPQAILRLWLI